jgi:hypothetical protein
MGTPQWKMGREALRLLKKNNLKEECLLILLTQMTHGKIKMNQAIYKVLVLGHFNKISMMLELHHLLIRISIRRKKKSIEFSNYII